MKRLLLLALTTGTLLMGTAAYAQCCCCGQMNGQQGTTPQEGVKKHLLGIPSRTERFRQALERVWQKNQQKV